MKQVLMDFLRCAAITRKGKRCSFKSRGDRGRCGHHPLKKWVTPSITSRPRK